MNGSFWLSILLVFSLVSPILGVDELIDDSDYPVGSTSWSLLVFAAFLLFFLSGLSSGLIGALLPLDLRSVKSLKKTGTDEQRKHATWVLPLVKRQNFILITLMACNTISLVGLPVILMELGVVGWLCIVVLCPLVLLFAEVLPTGIFTRSALACGYYFSPFIWLLVFFFGIFTWPLSKILDCLVMQTNTTFFRRHELGSLIGEHGTSDDKNGLPSEATLTNDEVRIIRGALEMRSKTCSLAVYTPIDKVFSLSYEAILDQTTRREIYQRGHSRIPIYLKQKHNFIGIALAKTLLGLEDGTPFSSIELVPTPQVSTDIPLFTLLNQFMAGKSHMAVVLSKEDNSTIVGVVTLEDIIEELLQSEIYDEKDIAVRARPGTSLDPTEIGNIPGAIILKPAPERRSFDGVRPVPEPGGRTPSSKRASHPRRKLYREISEASPLVGRAGTGYGGTSSRGPTQY